MEVLITYDISNQHPEVKAAMLKKGFHDYWVSDKKTYNLPNTSLWKKGNGINVTTVLNEFNQAINKLNSATPLTKNKIKIERCIVVECTVWAGIQGEKHATD
ncbi:hypothetical protein OQZ33_04205 [Pedobacter sp. MC2016-05]|uniref:hypothetical protein n=1 Tax=Pedobacter sp. MC2016-05 TaxID=2994474 RepID=UPI0022459D8A|nr:hypothetical protein [Pedobacter sp. MC2016-05]MCX2473528.1 hypothetical protein [Pedobacter sp. MC2016-05]